MTLGASFAQPLSSLATASHLGEVCVCVYASLAGTTMLLAAPCRAFYATRTDVKA
jgi:hypothetical protein